MSRTYRIRHLPHVPGKPKKYVDSPVRTIHRKIDEEINYRIAHELYDLPCRKFEAGYVRQSHGRCTWPLGFYPVYHLEKVLKREFDVPVGHKSDHPAVPYGTGFIGKKEHRDRANRAMRHRTRQLCHDLRRREMVGIEFDDDERAFPRYDDYFDFWDLT